MSPKLKELLLFVRETMPSKAELIQKEEALGLSPEDWQGVNARGDNAFAFCVDSYAQNEVISRDERNAILLFVAQKLTDEVLGKPNVPNENVIYKLINNDIPELISYCASRNVNVNQINNVFSSPLIESISQQKPECAKALLATNNITPEYASPSGTSALFLAVAKKDLELVKTLIASPNVKINQKDQNGEGVLAHALTHVYQKGSRQENEAITLEMIKLLVENGADVDKPGNSGRTPLLIASQRGSEPIALFLLENGAKPNVAANRIRNCDTILHYAIMANKTNLVNKLTELGADWFKENLEGNRPIDVLESVVSNDEIRKALKRITGIEKNGKLSKDDAKKKEQIVEAVAFQEAFQNFSTTLLDKIPAADRVKVPFPVTAFLQLQGQEGGTSVQREYLDSWVAKGGVLNAPRKDKVPNIILMLHHNASLESIAIAHEFGLNINEALDNPRTPPLAFALSMPLKISHQAYNDITPESLKEIYPEKEDREKFVATIVETVQKHYSYKKEVVAFLLKNAPDQAKALYEDKTAFDLSLPLIDRDINKHVTRVPEIYNAVDKIEEQFIDFLSQHLTLSSNPATEDYSPSWHQQLPRIQNPAMATMIAQHLIQNHPESVQSFAFDRSWTIKASYDEVAQFVSTVELFEKIKPGSVNINFTDEDSQNAVIISAVQDNNEMLRALIELNADINHKNAYEETALFQAIAHKSHLCLEVLLHYGADMTIKNQDGESVEDVAIRYNNSTALSFLSKMSPDKLIEMTEKAYRFRSAPKP